MNFEQYKDWENKQRAQCPVRTQSCFMVHCKVDLTLHRRMVDQASRCRSGASCATRRRWCARCRRAMPAREVARRRREMAALCADVLYDVPGTRIGSRLLEERARRAACKGRCSSASDSRVVMTCKIVLALTVLRAYTTPPPLTPCGTAYLDESGLVQPEPIQLRADPSRGRLLRSST